MILAAHDICQIIRESNASVMARYARAMRHGINDGCILGSDRILQAETRDH